MTHGYLHPLKFASETETGIENRQSGIQWGRFNSPVTTAIAYPRQDLQASYMPTALIAFVGDGHR